MLRVSLSHARTRAAARRSPVRQAQGRKSPAAGERARTPRDCRAGCACTREGAGEASVAVRAGGLLSVLPTPNWVTGESHSRGLLQGNLGGSLYSSLSVKELIVRRLPVTFEPQAIQVFANLFVSMQKDRHDADYDPYATFFKSQVIANIAAADVAIRQFNQAPRRDRRAFAVYVLLTLRS